MAKVYRVSQYCREGIEPETFSSIEGAYEYAFEHVKERCQDTIDNDDEPAPDELSVDLAEKLLKMEAKKAVLAWNAFFEKNPFADDYYLEVEEVTVK